MSIVKEATIICMFLYGYIPLKTGCQYYVVNCNSH